MEVAQGAGRGPGLLEADGRGLAKGGLIAALLLGACSTPAAAPVKPAPAVVAEAEANQPIGSRMPDGEDMCKAAALQGLIGKNKREIPVPVDVVNRRVVCSTCAVTMDYSPYRQNIFFNAQTDIIESVRCG